MNLALPQTFGKYTAYAITLDEYIQSADEKKVIAVFETMQTSWANKDITSFDACFTEDSDFVNFRGDHYKGKHSNMHAHPRLLNGILKNTRLYMLIKSIRFLNDTMAVVHTESAILQEYETIETSCKISYNTNILIKEKGEWKITSFHISKKEKAGLGERIIKWLMGSKR